MKLFTEIPLNQKLKQQIDYQSKVVLFGSCFVENIGKKFDYYKFRNLQNPLGVLFHPKAIERLILNAIEDKVYQEDDVFFHNDMWQCYDAHSKLSHTSKKEVLRDLNAAIENTNEALKSCSHIVITLGTAWTYAYLKTNSLVANCHKVPQKEFKKVLLSVGEIAESLTTILKAIREINPKATVLFTVSPIRHIKDGFVENTRSKSHLIAAIHQVLESDFSEYCYYFPAYEFMMDELRDYRFYESDLIHPNQTAIDYIWDKFESIWLAPSTQVTMKEVDTIQKGLQHKPFNLESEAHQLFLANLRQKIAKLQTNYEFMMFNS